MKPNYNNLGQSKPIQNSFYTANLNVTVTHEFFYIIYRYRYRFVEFPGYEVTHSEEVKEMIVLAHMDLLMAQERKAHELLLH
jgi:hypothetical protein